MSRRQVRLGRNYRSSERFPILKIQKISKSKRYPWSARDIYYSLIKGYTEKQWGRKANELPNSIIKRIPIRYTYDNNYFNDRYQGIPIAGYNEMTNKLLKGVDVLLSIDYLKMKTEFAYFNETGSSQILVVSIFFISKKHAF